MQQLRGTQGREKGPWADHGSDGLTSLGRWQKESEHDRQNEGIHGERSKKQIKRVSAVSKNRLVVNKTEQN